MQPIMRFDWISQLAVLLLGRNAVIDQLLVSAVLVEFGGAFFQACATPEGLTNLPGLVNNLLLFDELCERSEEHTSELQSLMRISYAVFCLKTKTTHTC